MFGHWDDFNRTFAALDELRRRLDERFFLFDDRPARALSSWPRVNIEDAGNALVVTAEVPGLTADQIELTLEDNTLTLAGERKVIAPEGYSVHRQERPTFRFKRSLSLPVRVDAEKVSATVKDGILTVTLEKAEEARPRQITVKAA